MKQIDLNKSVYELTEAYPDIIPILKRDVIVKMIVLLEEGDMGEKVSKLSN